MAFYKIRRQLTTSSISSNESVEYYTVIEVQEKLLAIYDSDESLFDEDDVHKIIDSVSYLRGFCQRQSGSTQQTIRMVKNCLIWRKETGLSRLTDFSFPLEMFQLGLTFVHGMDYDENTILYVRPKYFASKSPLREIFEKFLCYHMFKAYESGKDNCSGWVLFFDISGISMMQYDLPELVWLIKILITYYPSGLRRIIVHNVNWKWSLAKPFFAFITSFLPAEWKGVFAFATVKELLNYIPKASLPNYILKPNDKFVPPMPLGLRTVNEVDLNKLGVEDGNQEQFRTDLLRFVDQFKEDSQVKDGKKM